MRTNNTTKPDKNRRKRRFLGMTQNQLIVLILFLFGCMIISLPLFDTILRIAPSVVMFYTNPPLPSPTSPRPTAAPTFIPTPRTTRAPVAFRAAEREYLNLLDKGAIQLFKDHSADLIALLNSEKSTPNLLYDQDWRTQIWAIQLDVINTDNSVKTEWRNQINKTEVKEIYDRLLSISVEYVGAVEYVNDYYGTRGPRNTEDRERALQILLDADKKLIDLSTDLHEMLSP